MIRRHAIEALDRSLKNIPNNDKDVGAVSIVFGGYFLQALLIVIRGSRDKVVDACI